MKNNKLIQKTLIKILAHSIKPSEKSDRWQTTESLVITYDDEIRKQFLTIISYLKNE